MTTLLKFFAFAIITFSMQCNISGYNTIKGTGEVAEKELELSAFEELSFANGWNVKLVQANENKLIVKANKNLIDILKLDQKNQSLKISTKGGKNITKANSKLITLYFDGDLTKVKASSGVDLFAAEQLVFNNVEISSSSGSDVELNVKTQKLNCRSSSGSKMILKISSTDVIANSSSGSNLEINGKSTSLDANSSSGSTIDIDGYTDNFIVKTSSGSNINAENLKAINISASASSGSSIDVYPLESLTAESSSGARVKYHNKPSVNLDKKESSGGSVSM